MFSFTVPATTELYTLSLHDALPISFGFGRIPRTSVLPHFRTSALTHFLDLQPAGAVEEVRSEEHTSELQSPCNLVCRLLLEKKKHKHMTKTYKKQLQDKANEVTL